MIYGLIAAMRSWGWYSIYKNISKNNYTIKIIFKDKLIEKYGYISEVHHITTDDGYIIQLNRIVSKNVTNTKKPTVFLEHGFFGYSGNFLQNSNRSLGFYLSNNGFDVWLGNARGTRYSKNHTTLDNKSFQYWNFTWHDVGVKDLPASINYILDNTESKMISYIGHSQGTTELFALLSELPEYNNKINIMHAFTPVFSGKYIKSPVMSFYFRFYRYFEKIGNFFKMYVLDLESILTKEFSSKYCVSTNSWINVCDILLRKGTAGLTRNQTVF